MGRKVTAALRAIKVTAPAGGCEQGKFYEIQGFFGLALRSAAEGEPVVLEVDRAIYETTQIAQGDAFNVGDPVYWDPAAKVLTTNDGGGSNRLVGRVTRAKDAGGSIEFVLTGGV